MRGILDVVRFVRLGRIKTVDCTLCFEARDPKVERTFGRFLTNDVEGGFDYVTVSKIAWVPDRILTVGKSTS